VIRNLSRATLRDWLGVLLACASLAYPSPIVAATDPPPGAPWTAYPDIGSCSNCRKYAWTNQEGVACEKVTCLDPDWDQCNNTSPLCTPGSSFNTLICGGTGIENCTYVCDANGKGYRQLLCIAVAGSGTVSRKFCDYNAGCGISADGFLEGKPTTISQTCWTGQPSTTQSVGACGTGGCVRKLICKPGQPCCRPGIDPGCTRCTSGGETFDIKPVCGPGGAGYQCTFGKVTVSVPMPCPTVVRQPFPRALVGQPATFQIVGGCSDLPTASNRADVGAPYNQCGDTIFAYEGQLSWICSKPDQSDAEWTMDERAWNVGQTNALGVIPATRNGPSVSHLYETSSYDKAPNGPGFPNLSQRQPAYQVQLKTNYSLVGSFKYHYRTTERRCYEDAGMTQRRTCRDDGYCGDVKFPERKNEWQCRPQGGSETVIVSPTRELPNFIIGDIAVLGAKTPQDLANPNSCGVIATPVIQSQAVLKP